MVLTAGLQVLYPTTTAAGFLVREATSPAPNQPRLLDRVRATIRARHYSRRTEKAYVAWIRRFILTQFLSALAVDRNVAASTQNQHEVDLAHGAGWVELPWALARKYPNAGREWPRRIM